MSRNAGRSLTGVDPTTGMPRLHEPGHRQLQEKPTATARRTMNTIVGRVDVAGRGRQHGRLIHMTNRTTRQFLAVVAVTTVAMCADGIAHAAPASRTQVAEMAGRLVSRLASRLRRVVAAKLPWQERQRVAAHFRPAAVAPTLAFVWHRAISPFQFRLPPPLF